MVNQYELLIKHDLFILSTPWIRDYDARIEHEKIHDEIDRAKGRKHEDR